jgi:hypothetical protein
LIIASAIAPFSAAAAADIISLLILDILLLLFAIDIISLYY